MDRILQRILENKLAESEGLRVDASILVTEALANELIALALLDNQELTYCRVNIQRENRVSAELKSQRWPWPFHLKLRLFSSVDFTRSPMVRAFLENNVLLGKLGALFNALPPGIQIYEDQVSVDLGVFINLPEQKRLLDLIKAIEIGTEDGKIIFDVRIER